MTKEIQIPEDTLAQQFAASSPLNSSWVSANAGSGKTHVLTQRVIRLMLDGNPPDKILCLTFTKAAAANMKNRVFETLGAWTMMADEELDKAIKKTTGVTASLRIRRQARQLFASALDTPGGLKIQTIHGFCEALLHQFPLEANVPGHFEALQEIEQANLIKQARTQILDGSYDPDGSLAKHYEILISTFNDGAIETGLSEMIAKRNAFKKWAGDDLVKAVDRLYSHCGLSRDETDSSIYQACLEKLEHYKLTLASIGEQAATGSAKSDLELSQALTVFLKETDAQSRLEAIQKVLLTKELQVRKRLATKHVTDALPQASDVLFICAEYIIEGLDRIKLLQALQNSEHLFTLGHAIIKRYETLKRSLGAVDFDDQIEKAANLLNRSNIQDWIRYRLDNGIDHVLVDEAQDTSPAQWSIINAITSDFHTGETASKVNRTVFVVGDEKQSIFSFQGAAPEEFAIQQKRLQHEVKSADKNYHPGKLALSFRSTKDVLHAVDRVFENPENAKGLTQSHQADPHDAIRSNDPGEVQIWPIFEKQKEAEIEDWLAPVDQESNTDPAVQLAERITSKIGEWVDKPLPGMKEPLKFSDILVLVRKRDNRFINALTRTMKDKKLEIAGADRLLLTQHIAVEDLMAVGRVALMPYDNLSLAATLKGLLFNIKETLLFRLAHGRGNKSLYENIQIIALDKQHKDHTEAKGILEKLDRIIKLAQSHDVFSFYALIMGKMGGRKAMLSRLGMEAEDVLDSFLDEALVFTRESNGGLEGFIAELDSVEPEIKREVELDRNEVRILTVHASKGLEARLVFLVDPCGPAWDPKFKPKIPFIDHEHFLWVGNSKMQPHIADETFQELKDAAEAEYRRLLYVGMTRAADRLIVCGYKGTKEIKYDHWHKMVANALAPTAQEMVGENDDVLGLRWVSEEKPALELVPQDKKPTQTELAIPDWLFQTVPSDPPLPRPLTPSGAHALIEDITAPVDTVDHVSRQNRRMALERGNAIHKLLEMLPDVEPNRRAQLTQQYLDHIGKNWSKIERDETATHVLKLLQEDLFTRTTKAKTMAEVSLSGIIKTRKGELLITGQIDRLILQDEKISIVDYKSNRLVPETPHDVAPEYITQLTLYREMVRQIYPGKMVECSLLWTQSPEIMQIPDVMLDKSLHMIKNQ